MSKMMPMAELFDEGCKRGWKDASAQYDETDDHLVIMGKPVMERWETPFMHALADVAASRGGRVFETGFGMAISASRVETHKLDEHVIAECNADVFKRLSAFAEKAPNKVTPMKGFWEEVCPTLEDGTFDGVLYDTWPFSEETLHSHHFDFIGKHGIRMLKPGGVLTYSNVISWSKLMEEGKYADIEEMFRETQLPKLVEAGFKEENVSWTVIDIAVEEGCRYYTLPKVIVPKAIKE